MSSVCPTHDDLAAYALGKLPRERREEIDMHLDECAACQGELETCGNADDTFLSRLRDPESSEEFLVEAECADLLDRVAAIGREPSFVTQRQLDEATDAAPDLGNIGPYRLLAKLGAGGMGTVYKAFHPKLKRVVALKMLPLERMQDEQAIQRFEREMEAVGKLDHPNIIRATDAGDHDGKHFLVMEYVEGIDLSNLVRRHGPLPIADACEIIRQAAEGLQHAHDSGLVHRDIKPSNLMVTGDGNVKILDLGLALLPEQLGEGTELTSTGQAMGTLDYMAPEQGGDSHDVDIRADIYSLGATLYKLLTGQAIYAGPNYKTIMDKWRALATEAPSPIQQRRPEIPDGLAAVVHRMVAREVEDRCAAPQEVAEELAPFCEQADLAALAAGREATTPDEVTQSTTSLLKEAASLDTSLRPQESADLAPTQPHVDKGELSGATAGLSSSAQARSQSSSRRKKPNTLLIGSGAGLLGIVAVLAALVFYFQTPKGTLRVEIGDPDIEVKVKGQDIVLTNADKEPIKLKVGEHTLIVTRGDDFTFETKQLILKKGETTTVKVELLPGKLQVVSAGEVIGAKALNDVGSQFALEFDGTDDYVQLPFSDIPGPTVTIEAIVQVYERRHNTQIVGNPEKGGMTIECVGKDGKAGWSFAVGVDGTDYKYLRSGSPPEIKRYTHVAGVRDHNSLRLYVEGKLVAQEEIDETVVASKLPFCLGTNVELGEGDTIKAGDQFLCGQIKLVRISRTARYKADFTPVRIGERFEPDDDTVALYHFDEGSGDVLRDSSGNGHHGKIIGAKWVRVYDENYDRRAAERVLSIGGKLAIEIDGEYLRFENAQELPSQPLHVVSVNLSENPNLTDDDLRHLSGLQRLWQLSLEDTQITNRGLRHLVDLPSLSHLVLNQTETTTDGLANLSHLSDLTYLGFQYARWGESGLQHLEAFPKLSRLYLADVPVTDEDLKVISKLPRLEILQLNGQRLTDTGLSHLQTLKNLKVLEVYGAKRATPAGIAHLNALTQLTSLNLNYSDSSVSDEAIAGLTDLKLLKVMHLDGTAITDNGAKSLAAFENLSVLKLSGTDITDDGLQSFRELKELTSLNLSDTNVTESGVTELSKALPNCHITWDGGVIKWAPPLNGLSVKLRHDFGKYVGRSEGFGMDFSPDGKLLAVAGRSGVRLFDTATGELHRFVNCHDEEDFSTDVAFSPDGLLLASTNDGIHSNSPETVVCTTKDWKVRYRFPYKPEEGGQRLTFSPDGKQLACQSGGVEVGLRIFDVATGELVHTCSSEEKRYWGRDVAYSPDGKHILTTYREADPHIWNAETGELVQVVDIDVSRTYERGAYLSDREIVVEAGDRSYVVILQTNARKTRDDEFWALSPDRQLAASRGQGLDGVTNVILWATASGKVLAEITDHTAQIRDIAFSSDGKSLATTSDDGALKIWDLRRDS